MDVVLRYRPCVYVADLEIGECTIHRAGDSSGRSWWLLWFRVAPDAGGDAFDAAVPVNPRGTFDASGPGGKTWALQPAAPAHVWAIVPSINVLGSGDAHDGDHPTEVSKWHHVVTIEGVPDDEPWSLGDAPR